MASAQAELEQARQSNDQAAVELRQQLVEATQGVDAKNNEILQLEARVAKLKQHCAYWRSETEKAQAKVQEAETARSEAEARAAENVRSDSSAAMEVEDPKPVAERPESTELQSEVERLREQVVRHLRILKESLVVHSF